ncbi:ParA family protein [Nostoc sp. CHAB 5834]|nr:ParA family protein [Nostoc sp. CHAB 5834]
MTVVVFGAEKGGVGKTSLALGFASVAVTKGVDTVVLDTDRQQTANNWALLRSEDESLAHLSVFACGGDPLKEIASLAKRFELVVVDIGAQSYKTLVECALLSDLYLVPTSASGLDLDSTEALYPLLNKVQQSNRISSPIRVVLNRVPPHTNSIEVHRTRARLESQEIPMLDISVSLRSSWRSMANTGKALHELTGRSYDERAANEVEALYSEVVTLLKKKGKR